MNKNKEKLRTDLLAISIRIVLENKSINTENKLERIESYIELYFGNLEQEKKYYYK